MLLTAFDGPLLCLVFRFVSLLLRSVQSCIVADPSSPIAAADAACPNVVASFVVAPAARAAAIAC